MSVLYTVLFLCACSVGAHSGSKNAFLIIDIQYCFTAGGTLAVTDANDIIPVINKIRSDAADYFDLIVLSQDWHCLNHISFASMHDGKAPYENVTLRYNSDGKLCEMEGLDATYTVDCTGQQTTTLVQELWPDHCVKNTDDSELRSDLVTKDSDVIVRKGHFCHIDSYSVFYDNGEYSKTELDSVLQEHDIGTLFIAGLATDYCAHWTSTLECWVMKCT